MSRYIQHMWLVQNGPEQGGFSRVKVGWSFGEAPDFVEVRWGDDVSLEASATRAEPVPQTGQVIHDGMFAIANDEPTEGEVLLPAPRPQIFVGVFPQFYDPQTGGYVGSFPDENDVDQPWSHHGLRMPFATAGQPVAPSRTLVAPQFRQPEFGKGTVTLSWTHPEGADFFRLRYSNVSQGSGFVRNPTRPRQILYRTRAGDTYSAGVASGLENILGEDRWSEDEGAIRFTIPDGAGYEPLRVSEVQALSAVRRGGDSSVVVAGDGRAASLTRSASEGHHVWHLIGGPRLERFQHVSLISRSPNYMDAFTVIGGQAHVAWWGHRTWHDWQPLHDVRFPQHAAVGACTRNADFMDIFAVDTTGTVCGSWWDGPPWRPWYQLRGAVFPPGAPVVAACRNDDVNEIWAIDTDGDMRGRHWNGSWGDDATVWFHLAGPRFPPGGNLAAISPTHSHTMRVAAVDQDGTVQEITWDGEWGGWEERPGVDVEPGQPVALGAQDLWVVDNDGRIMRWLESQQRWTTDREADPPFAQPIAALGRSINAFTRYDDMGGVLYVGTVDPTNPEGPPDWWRDDS